MKNNISLLILTFFFISFYSSVKAQSVSLTLETNSTGSLEFNTIEKYQKGIIIPSFATLKVEAVGTEWDLYVGTVSTSTGFFDVNTTYSSSGNSTVPVGVLQARVYNGSNSTSTGASFFNLSDITNPVYAIGSVANDPTTNCGTAGANVAGSYTTQPQCYTFKVDLKATPGFNYRAGLYSLQVGFVLIQDL